jgi:hypothetical protein
MELVQNATTPIGFFLALASDHETGATGKSPVVLLSKAGGAFSAAAGSVAERGFGWYDLVPSVADVGTAGSLILHVEPATGVDPVNDLHWVGSDALLLGSTTPIVFFHALATDHITGATGLTPTVVIAKTGAGFASPAGAVAEIGYGWYKLTPTPADTGVLGSLKLHSTAATADPEDLAFLVEPSLVLLWSSADLVRRCKLHARRPTTDPAMPDANWYDFLTEAQGSAYTDLFSRYPDLQYGAPILLTTADGGKTYTFGSDYAGELGRPMGHTEVYPSLAAIPDSPLTVNVDFLIEGSLIRMLGNKARQFPQGPYARTVLRPEAGISASVQPQLYPKASRMLLVWKALQFWAARPGSGADQTYYELQYEKELLRTLTDLATQYNMAGQASGGNWFTRIDLAAGHGFLNT